MGETAQQREGGRRVRLITEVTLWGASLMLFGVALIFGVHRFTERNYAEPSVDWEMIDFARDFIKPLLDDCEKPQSMFDDNDPGLYCYEIVIQNEAGRLWSIYDNNGIRSYSLNFPSNLGTGFKPGDCVREDVRELGEYTAFTCRLPELQEGAAEAVYRIAIETQQAPDDRPSIMVALRADKWEERVDLSSARARWRRWSDTAIVVLVAAAAFALALFAMARRMHDHFNRLSTELDRYLAAEQPRIESEYPEEVQRLVDGFNRALDKSEGLISRQKRYVSKMAHDLRHQLVNIDVAMRERQGEEARREMEMLSKLVERYLTLVDWIGPMEGQGWTPVSKTLHEARRAFARRLRLTPVDIDVDCPDELEVRMHPTDLKIIIMNLLSNAHKYADSEIRLGGGLAPAEDGAPASFVLEIDDDGPGIPKADRDRALGWGGRLDDAAPGSGFGLTIVAEQVRELYGGDVALDEAPLGGLRARVTIPGLVRMRRESRAAVRETA